ncbi:hypothetical protein MettiDRAFT_1054 [Methanolobus tindarius DSM 2278]|uniref:Uncharacterized protein n=1 Tax=Methanolobus tindarius DSM 2278 TaxID=1090322 RepID=W9DVE3_METTI|nr:hypothetical protein [Methanolobus tindarius]ETA67627.1 hypothetical protein MettiDRAFT_1054 [Methanolobus tindarius DSM 2278]
MAATVNSTVQGLLLWTNGHDSLLTLLFTAVVALTTVVYAILTWKLVSETIKMRKVQTEPHISISIQPREEKFGLIDMIVQNIGLGPAYDVKFDISSDFDIIAGHKLSDIGFFKNGLQYFAPNQKIKFFMASAYQKNYNDTLKTKIQITATYSNASGTRYSSPYSINFSELEGLISAGESPIYEIAKSLDKINSNIDRIADGRAKIKTICYTKDEIDQQKKEDINKLRTVPPKENQIGKWGEHLPFACYGSIEKGTKIEVGNEEITISSLQYYDLLRKFRGKTVTIGLPDSRDFVPDGSLGAWLRDNVRRIPLAAYVGPILIKEGYAEKSEDGKFIIFKEDIQLKF